MIKSIQITYTSTPTDYAFGINNAIFGGDVPGPTKWSLVQIVAQDLSDALITVSTGATPEVVLFEGALPAGVLINIPWLDVQLSSWNVSRVFTAKLRGVSGPSHATWIVHGTGAPPYTAP